MLGFVSLRSLRLAAGVILLGVVGAIIALGLNSGPRSSARSSTRSATTRPSTASRPPPKSFQAALLGTRPRRGTDRIEGPYGRGGGEVWVLVPARPVRSVVVFGHGWKLAPPSPAYSWVGQFRPWLDHLAAAGSAVIFPRYQLGVGDPQDATRVLDFATGIHTGYTLLGRPKVPVVAVGYSFGASLVFYYGANAAAWRLPLPSAVQAVFPSGRIPGAPLPRLNRSVRVLIQVGEADTEAGSAGAGAFWSWLATHPSSRERYQVVRSSPLLAATHAAPKSASAAAQGAFWAPLDRLIAQARTVQSSGASAGAPQPPASAAHARVNRSHPASAAVTYSTTHRAAARWKLVQLVGSLFVRLRSIGTQQIGEPCRGRKGARRGAASTSKEAHGWPEYVGRRPWCALPTVGRRRRLGVATS